MQHVRGMQDVHGAQLEKFHLIAKKAREKAMTYGFFELQTPIVEFAALFERNLGTESDVIKKEIYKFEDRGGMELSLRPEFTAGIVRSFMENGFRLPARIFSFGPIFRYDRPQKGRYRQFNQINFEIFNKGAVIEDIEALCLAYNFLCDIGLKGKFTLEINTLGSRETLANYSAKLAQYFKGKNISEKSRERLYKNPLRILDSKEEEDREICLLAPEITDFHSKEESARFQKLAELLEALQIPYKKNSRIVRGLDYYTGLVFEFTTEHLGAQSAILGGGRYDNLVFEMGGKQTPAIGFAAGVERLSLLMETEETPKKALFILPLKEENLKAALLLAQSLRKENITVFILEEGNIGKRLEKASKEPLHGFALALGEKEEASGVFKVKNLRESLEGEGNIQYIVSCLK